MTTRFFQWLQDIAATSPRVSKQEQRGKPCAYVDWVVSNHHSAMWGGGAACSCVCMGMYLCVCMWKQKPALEVFPLLIFQPFFFETGSPTVPRTH